MSDTIKIKCKGSGTAAIDSLKVIQGDLKSLSEENKAKLRTRIETLGFDAPVFVWRGHVLDGTQRIRVLKDMVADGWVLPKGQVPVCEIGAKNLGEAKERLLGYVSQYGKIDQEGFMAFTEGLDLDFGTLDLPDFDLTALMDSLEPEPEYGSDPDDVPEPPKNPITKPGDLWILGDHRLLCGDSTQADDVERVTGAATVVLVHADPPYGMGKEKDGIANDNLYREKLDAFQMAWWKACRAYVAENGGAYIWGNAEDLWRLWYVGGMKDSERLTLRNEIVWNKSHGQGMESDQHRMFPTASERCLFFMLGEQGFNNNADNYWEGWDSVVDYLRAEKKKTGWDIAKFKRLAGHSETSGCHWFDKSQWLFPTKEVYEAWQKEAKGKAFKREHDDLKREFYATRAYFDNTHDNMTDVWDFPRVTGEDRHGHATPKPVAMIGRAIQSSSPEGGEVLDPFLGSGTTLIAAEKLNRKCYGLEIEPKYCDVIVERWETFTGQKAKREKRS